MLYFLSLGTLKEMAVGLAGHIIVEVVERESDGFYEVSFDEIQVRLLTRELEFKNFRLTTDSASRASFELGLEPRDNMYICSIPSLKMQIRSLYDLYFSRMLYVSSIELIEPEVQWHKSPGEKSPVTLSLETGEFYQLITEYLYHFEITGFSIQNGNFIYVKDVTHPENAYHVGPVNAVVKNFEIDEIKGQQKDKFLNTESLFLQIKDQTVLLADSIHVVQFDELRLSTENSEVAFKNLKLVPRGEKMPVPENLNSFEVTIPDFRIRGVDFVKAYNDNILDIGEIQFEDPTINIYEVNATKRRKRDLARNTSIADLITSLFDAVRVENFNLDKVSLDLKFYAGKNQDRFTVQNARVRLMNFDVDTSTVIFSRDNTLFDHIDFSVDHYAYFLPDSVHRLYVKNFRFSTLDSLISGDSLVIAPMEGLSEEAFIEKANVLKQFYVPAFALTGVELWKGWEEKDLAVQKLRIQGSEFYLKRLNDPEKNISFGDIANFYPYVKDIFRSVSVDSLIVGQSKVDIYDRETEKFSSPSIAVYATGFQIDSLTQLDTTNFFQANDLLLKVGKTKFLLPDNSHILEVGDFSFNPIRGDYSAADVNITPYYPVGWSTEGSIGKMKMTSFFLKEFLNEGKWWADSVSLFNPSLKVFFVRKGRKINNSILNNIRVETLLVSNGDLVMNLGDTTQVFLNKFNFSLQALNYDVEKGTGWSISDASTGVLSLDLRLPHNRKVEMRTISASVADSVFVSGSFNYEAPGHEGLQKFFSPSLNLTGIDIPALIKGDYVKWETAAMAPAEILWKEKAQKKDAASLAEALTSTKNSLLGDYAYIQGGKLRSPVRLLRYDGTSAGRSFSGIDLTFHDIYIDPQTNVSHASPGFSKNIELSYPHGNFSWIDEVDSLTFDQFDLGTNKKEIVLKGLYVKQRDAGVGYESEIPELVLKGIDWRELLFKKNFEVDTLEASLTTVNIENLKPQSVKEEDFLSFNWDSKSLENIGVGTLVLNGKSFRYSQPKTDKSWEIPEYSVKLKGFQLASGTSVTSKNLVFSKDYEIIFKGLSYLFPDSLYRMQADQLILSSKQPEVTLEGFRLLPRYGMYEFAHVVGHQTTWVMLRTKSVSLSRSDLYELLNGDKIQAGRVHVEEPFLRLFRDKRVPFPESQVRGLPHLQLLGLDQVIQIDSLDLRNGKIIYLEFAEEGKEPGQLVFSGFNARASNITNVSAQIDKNPYATLHAETMLMDQGLLKVDFVFDLTSNGGNHYVTGTLGALNLEKANAMLEPTAFVQVASGNLNEAHFNFEADTAVAIGTMDFFYKDLKVSVLNKKNLDKKGLGKSLETFFANTFIVNSNNPSFFITREGYIFFERDTSRSIINYWAKAFLSGVVSSIGAKNNKDKIKEWKQEVYEKNTQEGVSNGNK